MARGKADEDDVGEDRRLDAERAARVGGRQESKPVASEAESGSSDAVECERALEVGPRREPTVGRVPVRDDCVALHGSAGEARDVERVAEDDVGSRHRTVDIAVRERPIVDRSRLERIEDGVERVVVDLDELGGVFGQIPVAGDDDRERLADVPCRLDRCRVLGGSAVDPGGERA